MAAPSSRAPAGGVAANTGEFTTGDWALFMGISLIWGSSFLLIDIGLEGFTPGMITLGRVSLGAATLFAIRSVRRVPRIDAVDRPRIALLSVIWVAIPFTIFPLAQEHINSAVTGLLNGATPIFAGVVSTVLLRAAPRARSRPGCRAG